MSDFEAWLSNLEREVERLPVLHGDHAGVKAELSRLVAYGRGRAGAPPPASEPEPAAPPEPEAAPAPSDEQPQ